jgi:hypothetical protein
MAKTVEFVSEMEDLSSEKGYQFTFHCDKCHRGYTSSYQATPLGIAADLLGTAGGVFESFGSIFGKSKQAAKGVQEALGGKTHSDAYAEAVEEVKHQFKHCSRCGHWVCMDSCWNVNAGLCEECAPNVKEEFVFKQTHLTVEQLGQRLSEQDLTKGMDLTTPAQVVTCAKCGADLAAGAKFCSGCGEPVRSVKGAFCSECGAKLSGGKFCPSCGKPIQ